MCQRSAYPWFGVIFSSLICKKRESSLKKEYALKNFLRTTKFICVTEKLECGNIVCLHTSFFCSSNFNTLELPLQTSLPNWEQHKFPKQLQSITVFARCFHRHDICQTFYTSTLCMIIFSTTILQFEHAFSKNWTYIIWSWLSFS